ncbi:hypothetical protein [Neisseria gonorrhoeae]|uniref:hypothetical protein n=1 Tax=Neisseria gonorrhoeae TaxID=485 RepID=UPI00142FA17C|nr:hypothetical protein [Neisseria gonorrhoeae]
MALGVCPDARCSAAGIARQIGNGGGIHGTLAFSLLFLSLGHIGMVAYHTIKGESVLPCSCLSRLLQNMSLKDGYFCLLFYLFLIKFFKCLSFEMRL